MAVVVSCAQPDGDRKMDEHNNSWGLSLNPRVGRWAELCMESLDDVKLKTLH